MSFVRFGNLTGAIEIHEIIERKVIFMSNSFIYKYIRRKRKGCNVPVGVLMAYRYPQGVVGFSYSKYNSAEEPLPFSKKTGVNLALSRAITFQSNVFNMADRRMVIDFMNRAARYFKDCKMCSVVFEDRDRETGQVISTEVYCFKRA